MHFRICQVFRAAYLSMPAASSEVGHTECSLAFHPDISVGNATKEGVMAMATAALEYPADGMQSG